LNILLISGSVRKHSYNTALLNAIYKLALEEIKIEFSNSIVELPAFIPNVDENSFPETVKQLITKIRQADGIIISTPEYAHGIPGTLKNALDWMVDTDALVLKPVVVTSVSTSGLGGVRSHCSLVQILSAMNANVVIDGSLCVPYAKIKFDENLILTDNITMKALEISLLALQRTI